MLFRIGLVVGFFNATQQTVMMNAHDQAEEVFRCLTGPEHPQRAGLVRRAQQFFHFIMHLLRPGFMKQPRQCRIVSRLGDHQPLQGNGFFAVDQHIKSPTDAEQHRFNRTMLIEFEKEWRKLFFALGFYGRREQGFLVGEMAVQGQLGHAGLGGNRGHAALAVPLTDEQPLGGLKDGRTLGRIFGAARPSGHGMVVSHGGLREYWTGWFSIDTIPTSTIIRNLPAQKGSPMRLRIRPSRFVSACSVLLLLGCAQEAPPPVVTRPALVVQPQPATDALSVYPGEVRARFEPELAFRISGKVTRRLVEAGTRVKKDQPLAELDPQDVQLQLEAARAQVAAAEANLNLARGERDRYKTLLDRQMISRSQYDNVENQFKASEARLKQIRAEFDVASNQAGYSVLRASQDGVIARRLVEVGQVVAAGQTVFTLAVDGEREVLIGVPEHAIDRFQMGQDVAVELWTQPGKQIPARIREVSPAADPQSRTFAARVTLASNAPSVEVGQSARVFIRAVGTVPLSVPLSAVTADQNQAYVWVVNPATSKVEQRPVRVNNYGQQRASITEGLKENEWVVSAGVHLLQPGQSVRPVDRDNRPVTLVAAGE